MTRTPYQALAALALLALAACGASGEASQAGERGIDQDIAATHDAGAPTLNNMALGQFAPWRLGMKQ